MPIPNSSSVDVPPYAGGSEGWTQNVLNPNCSRNSRSAVVSKVVLPPWALSRTTRSTPVVANERPISRRTDIIVSADNHSVPGDQACSFDFDTDSVGNSQMSNSSPTRSTTADAASWAIT